MSHIHTHTHIRARAHCLQYLCSWVMHFIIAFAMKPLGRRRKETTLNGSNVCSEGKRRFSLKPCHCIKYPGLVTHLSSGFSFFPAPVLRLLLHSSGRERRGHSGNERADVQMCEIRPIWQKNKKIKNNKNDTCVSALESVQL